MAFKKGHIVSIEIRKKISKANRGKHRSEETKEKLREYQLGRKHTKEHTDNLKKNAKTNPNYGMKGKHFTEASKRKMSWSRKIGLKQGKIKVWNKGIKHGDLRKTNPKIIGQKMAKTRKERSNYFHSSITKRKISAPRRGILLKDWDKFTHYEPYGNEFNIHLKNKIRKRDNQICMNCGKHREQLKVALTVHHINYDKTCHLIQNLISLCRSCHGLTMINRGYWKQLFQNKLNKLYSYEYKNGEILLKL